VRKKVNECVTLLTSLFQVSLNVMPRLYTYTIPVDDGAAPNPFGGICTLAICKPAIRKTAEVGDWVVGLGSKNAPSGDLSKKVVYAMEVTKKVTLKEYYWLAQKNWPFKIPRLNSVSLQDRLGDCIYDYSEDKPKQIAGVHSVDNEESDLDGHYVLISERFYYWGSRPQPLIDDLLGICHQTQGHKSKANQPYVARFIEWIESLGAPVGQHGWPDYIVDWRLCGCNGCATAKNGC
jgi:hypothetical protein